MRVCHDDLTLYVDQRESGLWTILADKAGPVMIECDLDDIPNLNGSVWRARVTGIQNGIGVFLDAGDPIGEVFLRQPRQPLQPGTRLLVGLAPATEEGKRPRATLDFALPGRSVVHLPQSKPQVRFPNRVAFPSPEWRAAVDRILSGREGTWVVRRFAMTGVAPEEIAEEADWLAEEAAALPAAEDGDPGLVREGLDALDRIMTHQPSPVRGVAGSAEIGEWLEEEGLPFTVRADALSALDLDGALAAAVRAQVPVGDDIDLWIEYTRLGWAIDIDCRTRPDENAMDRAFGALLRQIRLRNISGQIVVDPPRLQDPARSNLIKRIRRASEWDPAGLNIFDLSALGFVEMTRQRRGLPLVEMMAADAEFRALLPPGLAATLRGGLSA